MTASNPPRTHRGDMCLNVAVTIALIVMLAVPVAWMVLDPQAANAAAPAGAFDPPTGYQEGAEARDTLLQVINNIRNLIMGLLAAVATLLLTIAGVRYLVSGGDPSETEKAKAGVKAAAVGYGLAFLAPVIAGLLSWVVQVQ